MYIQTEKVENTTNIYIYILYFQGRPQILIGALVVLLETPQTFIGDPQFFLGDLQNFIWVYTVKRCGSPTKI